MAPRKKIPNTDQQTKQIPDSSHQVKELPDAFQDDKKLPDAQIKHKKLPDVGRPENTVIIGGQVIEIKPTKLKYQRNRTATFYHILELYPLADIVAMDAGQFGDDRDGDKAVMDWLIAVTDNEQLITDNYDDLDTGTIEKMLQIFKRVNKIQQKDDKLKNLTRTQKTV